MKQSGKVSCNTSGDLSNKAYFDYLSDFPVQRSCRSDTIRNSSGNEWWNILETFPAIQAVAGQTKTMATGTVSYNIH